VTGAGGVPSPGTVETVLTAPRRSSCISTGRPGRR
jgi:hypothetical protein